MSADARNAVCINKHVWLGELDDSNDVGWLRDTGVRHVLRFRDCPDMYTSDALTAADREYLYRSDSVRRFYEEESIKETVIDLDDNHLNSMLKWLPSTTQAIANAVAVEEPILVHCNFGRSRSPTAVLAYLIHADVKRGGRWDTAWEGVKQHLAALRKTRPTVQPSRVFMRDLEEWAERCVSSEA